MARSRHITGPYELHPNKHLICAADVPTSALQKTGHADICQHPDGRWWLTFLCGRPIDTNRRCPLGRETSMAEVVWIEDWPYLKEGGMVPPTYFEGYGEQQQKLDGKVDFTSEQQMLEFQSLRVPAQFELLNNGALRIFGGESLMSLHHQNMLVRRQDCRNFTATAQIRFEPESFQQMAGIIYRYNEENQYYIYITWDESKNCRCVNVISFDHYQVAFTRKEDTVFLKDEVDIWLRISVRETKAFFSCSVDGQQFQTFPNWADVTILSDEYATSGGFTGAFVGMACQDLYNHTAYADFMEFIYKRES